MSANAYVPSGTTLVFGTSGFDSDLTSINWGSIGGRDKIDATPLAQASGYSCNLITKILDPGTIALEGNFDPDKDPLTFFLDGEVLTITYPIRTPSNTTNGTWSANVAVSEYETGDMTHDDKVTFSMTVEVLGEITITPESA